MPEKEHSYVTIINDMGFLIRSEASLWTCLSFGHSLTQSLTHSLTHSLNQLIKHSYTHSPYENLFLFASRYWNLRFLGGIPNWLILIFRLIKCYWSRLGGRMRGGFSLYGVESWDELSTEKNVGYNCRARWRCQIF